MRTRKADREFETVISRACEEYAGAVPCPEEVPEHEFSPEFEARMAEAAKKVSRKTGVVQFARRAAAVFAAVVLSLGCWLAVDGETRADFVSWLREGYESSVLYSFRNEIADSGLPDVELGWIPEGYELVEESRDDTQLIFVYRNAESDKEMIFSISRPENNGYFGLIFEESEAEHIQTNVNGMYADLYLSCSESVNSSIVWIDEQNVIIYSIFAYLNEDDILHIAENVKLSE